MAMTMGNSFLPTNNPAQGHSVVQKDNLTDVVQGPTAANNPSQPTQPATSAPTQPAPGPGQVVDNTGHVVDLGLRAPVIKK